MVPRLQPSVEGPEDGPLLVFVHGWPDDAAVWDAQVAALRGRYRCIRVTLPNFGAKTARWGWTTDEIVHALTTCIEDAAAGRPVTLVLHDWGAYWGYLVHRRRPNLACRVVGLDIAPDLGLRGLGLVLTALYQGWLWAAFVIGGFVGDGMSRAVALLFSAPRPLRAVHAWMNYPYRNFWRDRWAGAVPAELRGYRPEIPLLYVYGAMKPAQFQADAWLAHVRAHGAVHRLAWGHWVMTHPGFTDLIVDWLRATDPDLEARQHSRV